MRLFIGSRLSASSLERVGELRDLARPYFGRSVTWVAPENLHVTCAFLGEVSPEAGLPGIKKRMDAAAGAFREIGVTLGGLGAFPSFERPLVLWLGFTAGADELKALALQLAIGLKEEGFALARDFFPHVTLGRVKAPLDGAALAAAVNKARGLGIRDTVASLELIESRLSRAGADHRTLYSSRLL
jgi:RNA 2',3'-cyclic 3'-phosphodiesterase